MGCIGSHLSHLLTSDGFGRDSHLSARRRSVFPVLNVDELGRHISPGKLEVTEGDLILHINGRPSLVWPLRALRRYGYENDLFSFEAGRRCPTGHGIYAFKCSAAQTLFELLQLKIQGNPGAVPIIPHNPRLPNMSSASAQANLSPLSLSPTFDYVNILEPQEEHQHPRRSAHSAVDPLQEYGEDQPLYVNVEGAAPSYANLESSTVPKPSTSNGRLGKLRNGLPHHISESPAVLYTNLASLPPPTPFNPEVNYAELDLEQGQGQGQNKSQSLSHPQPTIVTPSESPISSRVVVSRTTSVTSRVTTTETALRTLVNLFGKFLLNPYYYYFSKIESL